MSLTVKRLATSTVSLLREITAPTIRPSAIVSEVTSLSSHTAPPLLTTTSASDFHTPIVPSGQKPKFLNALLRVK